MPVKYIIFIVLSIIVAIFIVKNMGDVEIKYYNFYLEPQSAKIPLFIVMLASMTFGFLLAWIDGWVARMKLKNIIRRNNRIIDSLDEELDKNRKTSLPEYTETEK